jgi:hypothetical protein
MSSTGADSNAARINKRDTRLALCKVLFAAPRLQRSFSEAYTWCFPGALPLTAAPSSTVLHSQYGSSTPHIAGGLDSSLRISRKQRNPTL